MRTSLIRQYPLAASIDTVSAWVWVQADVARATRGSALSRLLGNRSPLLAGLLLGIPWGIIHIILHLPCILLGLSFIFFSHASLLGLAGMLLFFFGVVGVERATTPVAIPLAPAHVSAATPDVLEVIQK